MFELLCASYLRGEQKERAHTWHESHTALKLGKLLQTKRQGLSVSVVLVQDSAVVLDCS